MQLHPSPLIGGEIEQGASFNSSQCQYNKTPSSVSVVTMDLHQDEVKGAVQKLLELKLEYKRVSGHEYQAGAPPGKVNEAANGAALAPDCVPSDTAAQEAQTDHVDPWNVQTSSAKGIDYDKLIGMASESQTKA